MEERRGKKAQVTIFIIVAIIVVVAGILIYIFLPEIKGALGVEAESPSVILENCLASKEIGDNIEVIARQGGYMEPEHYILYQGEKIEYLCYSEEYYRTCVMQQPMLKKHIEKEIQASIADDVKQCFDDLKNDYERQGYDVNLGAGDIGVELLPQRIVLTFNKALTLTRGETKSYPTTKVILNNNLYELVSIADSILSWEAVAGDVETTTYMDYYHNLKVEKLKQGDGSTIYILTDRNTGDKLQFASRSVALPPGYGLDGVTYEK